jgi:DNA-binding NarL/FixJ family response regulator
MTVEMAIGDTELAERVREMLTARPGFDIVSMDDGRTPDVLITDAAEELADETADAVPALMLGDLATAADALRLRAMAVLPLDIGAEALRAAVRAAALGLITLPAEFRYVLAGQAGHQRTGGEDDLAGTDLTARELQVLQLLAEGASNKAIARRLGITPHTAKFHVAAIAGKLGASGRTDAVAKAMRLGLVMV